ncbi:hypothetical protein TWF506_011393 [Arthrobotrys conoides]|uniref:F-box domain-containing protein n=1 Tax=Arthrobotrys conoides TaxID=74498 RepID=A0AAN8N771_9PEZI
MESSITTFSTLPYDIIHEVYDYLTDEEVLKLRFASKQTCSTIPRSRLDKIFSKRTLFFTNVDAIGFLHLLTTSSDEDLARIKHLVFDLADPHVSLISAERFHNERWKYDDYMKSKMMVFPRIYRERNIQEMPSGLWKHKDTKRVGKPDIVPVEKHPESCYKELYKILQQNIESANRTAAYSDYHSKAWAPLPLHRSAYFDALTSVFKHLPNLSVIEFRIDEPGNPDYKLPQSWIRHNMSLKFFCDKYPEFKDLPSGDWFAAHCSPVPLIIAYPAVLFCATQAKCRISEIRANRFPPLVRSNFGVDIRDFDPFDCGTLTPPGPYSDIDFKHPDSYISDYRYTFANLKRLEIYLLRRIPPKNPISPLFELTLQNVEELVVIESPSLLWEGNISQLPLNIHLPKLRRLETKFVPLSLDNLKSIMQPNQPSLKELICTFSLQEKLDYDEIFSFLENLRKTFDLTTCNIDFFIHNDWEYYKYLFVEIQGDNWRDDEGCIFKVAIFTTYEIELADEERKKTVEWEETDDWESFGRLLERYRLLDEDY